MTPFRRLLILLSLACAMVVRTGIATAGTLSPEQLGERIYMRGIGVNGRPIAVIDASGQAVFAPQFHCVSCHRRSGFGSKEGGIYIPPIAAPVLFKPMVPDRARAFNGMYFQQKTAEMAERIYQARTRPAYDRASLARALREGIDPAGKPLPTAMPRFHLANRDIAALDAWLHTLSARPDPGVDDTAIHFAVVVSDTIDAPTRKSLLDTVRAFARRTNRTTEGDRARTNFSPFYRSGFAAFWRNWDVDVWELTGPRDTWPAQLRDRYAAKPVFAVIGGAVGGPWQPVADFCNRNRVPCLFPLTDLPESAITPESYTIYSYGGLPLEADALAAWLARGSRPLHLVQLAADDPAGAIPAQRFAQAYRAAVPSARIETIRVGHDGWSAAVGAATGTPHTMLVVWPADRGGEAAAAVKAKAGSADLVAFASAAQDAVVAAMPGDPRVRVIHPRDMPGVVNPHSYRVRAWLDARQVAVDPPEDQFQVYYALSVLDKAVMEIQGDFSRQYLIEQIEMIAESNLNPGVFPYLSLGPGQRVASRGAYVVKLDRAAAQGIAVDGEWIVP